jgi:hypothetical protein
MASGDASTNDIVCAIFDTLHHRLARIYPAQWEYGAQVTSSRYLQANSKGKEEILL